MTYINRSPNNIDTISAQSSINGRQEYLYSTNHALDVYIAGGSSSGTQYTEGDTNTPGVGTLSIGRYMLSAPSLSDGELYGLQLDNSGNLKVTGSLSVGGTTDNSSFTAGTSTGTPAMGFYHSTIDTVTDGRSAAVGITSKRAMLVNLQTAAGVETGIAAAPLQVSLANTGSNSTPVSIAGNIASGATDSGNPVKVGGIYNSTKPTFTDGQRGDLQLTTRGSLLTTLVTNDSNTVVSARADNADAVATSGTANNLAVISRSTVYNGTSWDRQYGTTLGTYTLIRDAAGNSRGANVDSNNNLQVGQATAANLNATVVGTGTFAVQSTPVVPTTIFNGVTTVTTAGTRVTLASSQTVKSVTIKALSSNTGTIYVGNSGVSSSNGFQLAAGDTISLDLANLNTVNIDASVNGEGVSYLGVN